MKCYIFRHAETFPSKNTGGIYDGDNYHTPILYSGKDATIRLAHYLKDIPSDFNVTSPYERCQETVAIISQITGKQFTEDVRVGEYFQIDYSEYRKRIEDFLKEVKEKGYQNVLICTHGATMSQLIHLICDDNPEEHIPTTEAKAPGILIIVEGKDFKEIDFND